MLNILPKSGFEVIHPSASQLVVVAHPAYGWTLLVVLILLGVYFGARSGQSNLSLGLFLLALGFVVVSGLLSHGQAVFDKNARTVTFTRVGFFFCPSHASFPLDQVRYASVESSRGSDRFIVAFKGGGREDITASSGAHGQYKAVDAVNEFLGVNPIP